MPELRESFLARQPILDARQRIVGHELLYRSSAVAESAQMTDVDRATASVLVGEFASLDPGGLSEGLLNFVNVSADFLTHEVGDPPTSSTLVLELPVDIPVDEAFRKRCREIQQAGCRLALSHYQKKDPRDALLNFVDYAKVDARALPLPKVKQLVSRLKRTKAKIIVEKIEDRQTFHELREMGVHFFQGFYFAKPDVQATRRMEPGRNVIMTMLIQLRQDVDLEAMAETLKANVALSTTLLKLINSGAFQRSVKIESIPQAMVIIGRRQLARWLTLLLYASSEDEMATPLLETAAQRGRMLEILETDRAVAEGHGDRQTQVTAERAFLAGMLSLLDTLLEIPMEQVVDQIPVEDEVRDALLHRSGRIGHLLAIQDAATARDFETLTRLTSKPESPTTRELAIAAQEATAWAHSLGAAAISNV